MTISRWLAAAWYKALVGALLLLGSLPAWCAPAPVAGQRLASDGLSRIVYPSGHHPAIRLSNGKTSEIRSLLAITHPLNFGDYMWSDTRSPQGPVWVRVDLAHQQLSVFRGGDEIGTAVIIYGARSHPTPVGLFAVLARTTYYYSKSYDAPMPYALRLTGDGVALHASSVRERRATHGCIGTPLAFARLMFNVMRVGDRVEIVA